jgi:hypothetical protein
MYTPWWAEHTYEEVMQTTSFKEIEISEEQWDALCNYFISSCSDFYYLTGSSIETSL